MKYKGIVKERELWVKIAAIIASFYLLYREFAAGQYIYVILAVLVILACFFEKEHVISKEGVDIKYILFKTLVKHNYWTWDEVTTMHPDYKKAKPNVMLHIGKDVVTRSFIMKPEDCRGAIELARQMNPNIYIDDITAEEQERRDEELLHRQQVARAQRQAQRKKNKNK